MNSNSKSLVVLDEALCFPEIFMRLRSRFDKKFFFESGIRENLRVCAVTGCIPVCNRDGYQTAIILRQQTTWIQIPDIGRIVKTEFFCKQAEMLGLWATAINSIDMFMDGHPGFVKGHCGT